MAVTKVLARSFKLEIKTGGTDEAPVYTTIKGINSFTFSTGKSDADTTDFDSAGRDEHIAVSRNMSISCEGFYLEDLSTKARDPGQQAVETLADKVGEQSIEQFRISTPGGSTKTFKASAEIGDVGGGNNDMASWSATLVVSGVITTV